MVSIKITTVIAACVTILILISYSCKKKESEILEEPRFFSPSNFKATVFSDSIIRVSWKDNSNVETSFQIQRKQGLEAFKLIKEVAPNDTVFLDADVTPNLVYTYRIRAIGKSSETSFSDEVMIKLDLPIPVLAATIVSDSEIKLTWTDNSSLESGFVLERSIDGQTFIPIAEPGKNVQFYSDKTIEINTTYKYRIKARNKSTVTEYSNLVTTKVNFQAPKLNHTFPNGNTIDLSWIDNSEFETGYVIEESIDGKDFTELAKVDSTILSFRIENLQTAKKNSFRVKAYSAKNKSSYSNIKRIYYNDKRYSTIESYSGESSIEGQVALSPSTNLIATTNYYSENVMVSNRLNHNTTRLSTRHKNGCYSTVFSADNAYLLVTGAKDGYIEIWNTSTLTFNKEVQTGMEAIYSLTFNKSGTLLAVGGTGGSKILIYNFPAMTLKYTLTTDNHNIRDILFYENDSKIISCGNNKKIQVWKLSSLQVETTLIGHVGNIGSIDLNATSSVLVSGSYEDEDKTIKIWNPTSALIRTISNPASVTTVFIDADDTVYFTDRDGYLRIIDKFGTKLYEVSVGSPIYFADFNEVSKIFVTYSANGKTNVFRNAPIWMEY